MSCEGQRFGIDFTIETPQSPTLDRILYYDFSANVLKESSIDNMIGNSSFQMLPSGIQGDTLYHNGTEWVVLNAGTSGQVLQTNGTGANPSWEDAAVTTTLERLYEFSANYVKRIERQFQGGDEIQDNKFSTGVISSTAYRTRLSDGSTYTNRIDITAVNSYLASLLTSDLIELEIVPTFDGTFLTNGGGKGDCTLQFIKG